MTDPDRPADASGGDRHVFVYGTLRRGDDNDITRRRPAPRFVGCAQARGTMYHLGGYPGVRLDGAGTVVGEVYAVPPALEAELDALEGVAPQSTGEYAKREITLMVNGRPLRCLVYEIQPAFTEGCPVIPSGDWVRDRHTPGLSRT